jgi:hypothetical protein
MTKSKQIILTAQVALHETLMTYVSCEWSNGGDGHERIHEAAFVSNLI